MIEDFLKRFGLDNISFTVCGDQGSNIVKSAFQLLAKKFNDYNHFLNNTMKSYDKNED